MNTHMNSMSDEQLTRFAQFALDVLSKTDTPSVEVGRSLVFALSGAVKEDNQTLVFVRLDTDNNYVARDLVNQAICEIISHRNPPEDYVAKRYASHDQDFRDRKLPQIEEKIRLCENAGIEV